jgi:hypothetical protein
MAALVALNGTTESSNELATIKFADWGGIANVHFGRTPSAQYLVCTGGRGPARVSVTVVSGPTMKKVTIGAPVVIENNLDFPMEMACLTSMKAPTKPDSVAEPGAQSTFPLGLMENVDPGELVPLYSFRNATTLHHFYTTDVVDIGCVLTPQSISRVTRARARLLFESPLFEWSKLHAVLVLTAVSSPVFLLLAMCPVHTRTHARTHTLSLSLTLSLTHSCICQVLIDHTTSFSTN